MKRAGIGRIHMALCVAVWLFFAVCAVYGAWALATDNWRASPETMAAIGMAPGREKWYMILGVPLFASFVVFFAYRVFYLGCSYVLYNEEMVVFVLNRRDRRSYCWKDLGFYGVTLRNVGDIEPGVPLLRGWFFEFPDGKRMPVRAIMAGYRDFEALLVRKGLLPRGWGPR